jgi:Fe2+ transport system protein FeoA
MARLMSVALTTRQVRDRSKTVTRRLGWLMLAPGDPLTLCEKVRGRRPGEPLVRITDVTVVSVRRERLDAVTVEDVVAEGFPQMSPEQFVAFFCRTHRGCFPADLVTRIQWSYLG